MVLGYRRPATGPIGQTLIKAFQKPRDAEPCDKFTVSEDFHGVRISVRMLAFVAAALAAVPLLAPAQPFPHRAVKIVVPTSRAARPTRSSRALAPRFSEIWGQPVLVENRPAQTRSSARSIVSKSAPDGATLLVSDASSFVINPHLYKKLPYNGLKEFHPDHGAGAFPVGHRRGTPRFPRTLSRNSWRSRKQNRDRSPTGPSAWAPRRISASTTSRNLLGLDIVHVP